MKLIFWETLSDFFYQIFFDGKYIIKISILLWIHFWKTAEIKHCLFCEISKKKNQVFSISNYFNHMIFGCRLIGNNFWNTYFRKIYQIFFRFFFMENIQWKSVYFFEFVFERPDETINCWFCEIWKSCQLSSVLHW